MSLFKDFSQYNQEQLMELIKKYNQRLYKTDPESVLFDQIVQLRDTAQQHMDELMFIENYRETNRDENQTLDIGEVESSEHTPDYSSNVLLDAQVTRGNK